MDVCGTCTGRRDSRLCSTGCQFYWPTHTSQQRMAAMLDAADFDLTAAIPREWLIQPGQPIGGCIANGGRPDPAYAERLPRNHFPRVDGEEAA